MEFIQDQFLERNRHSYYSVYNHDRCQSFFTQCMYTPAERNKYPHVTRREHFDSLLRSWWLDKFVRPYPKTHSLKSGQIAFVDIASRRGETTLPSKFPCYVRLIRPKAPGSNYWHVALLFRAVRSTIAPGMEYVVHAGQLRRRVDLSTTDDLTTSNFLRYVQSSVTQEWFSAYKNTRTYRPARNQEVPYARNTRTVDEVRSAWWLGYRCATVISALRSGKVSTSDQLRELLGLCGGSSTAQSYPVIVALSSAGFLMTSCGHWAKPEDIRQRHDGGSLCHECTRLHIDAGILFETLDGSTPPRPILASRTYGWSDGTTRGVPEPPVIGAYHSGKQYHTQPLPYPDGKPLPSNSTILKVGFELEFSSRTNAAYIAGANHYARMMQRRLAPLNERLNHIAPYATFEKDGSVWFEMVTGYGAMETHREAVSALLATTPGDAGTDPLHSGLSSHDGGACGLHVHLDVPDTLSHALRLTHFYHAPENRKLVEAVARRYGTSYAKAQANKASTHFRVACARSIVRYGDGLALAMRRINGEDRREVVNWLNAPKSVEIRVFRGSMKPDTVLACLEFAVMSWYFSRDTPVQSLTCKEFCRYISRREWRHETKYLRAYLAAHGFRVFATDRTRQQSLADYYEKEVPDLQQAA